jgi:hypothetical protein
MRVQFVLSRLRICMRLCAPLSSADGILSFLAPEPGSRNPRAAPSATQSADKDGRYLEWISLIGWVYEGLVQASIRSSIRYIALGGAGAAIISAAFVGRRIEHSCAVFRSSSWRGPATAKPARDCVKASIPNCIASGPSLLPPSTPPGKNLATMSVRWRTFAGRAGIGRCIEFDNVRRGETSLVAHGPRLSPLSAVRGSLPSRAKGEADVSLCSNTGFLVISTVFAYMDAWTYSREST